MPKSTAADLSTCVLSLRLKDKHAPWLRVRAAEVNFVWNYCNEASRKVLERAQRFISAYELDALPAGSSRSASRGTEAVLGLKTERSYIEELFNSPLRRSAP